MVENMLIIYKVKKRAIKQNSIMIPKYGELVIETSALYNSR